MNRALAIIDEQRGFMPASEGERLGLPGFGELPIEGCEVIIAPTNRLAAAFGIRHYPVSTTQDDHPRDTAHFSEHPNYDTTWPVHCVTGTPGAELHPELVLPRSTVRFIKGFEPLTRGEDDTSYSALYAVEPITNTPMPEWFEHHNIEEVVLAGDAIEKCLGFSALDFRRTLGLDVTVAIDAACGLTESGVAQMLGEFAAAGIRVATTDELIAELEQE